MSLVSLTRMRIISVDVGKRCGWSVLDVPNIGRATVAAMGELDANREAVEFGELIAKYAPTRATIEAPIEPYVNSKAADGTPAQRRSILISLLWCSRLAGKLEREAELKGLRVEVVDAAHVRRAFGIRGANTTSSDRAVKAHVKMMIVNWPKQSNDHERDSAAAGLYVARMP